MAKSNVIPCISTLYDKNSTRVFTSKFTYKCHFYSCLGELKSGNNSQTSANISLLFLAI